MKALLDRASVEWAVGGKGFTVEALAEASMVDLLPTNDLSDLEHNYLLVRARPHSCTEADQLTLYEFLYWLYGSYIYDRVPEDYRPELHLRVAQCLDGSIC